MNLRNNYYNNNKQIGTWKIEFYERLKLQVVNDYKKLQKREYEEQF